jgi:putative oxidoreductase
MGMNTTQPASNVPVVRRLFITQYGALDAVLLVLRLALAVVIFPHGAQKMLGWFGGYGFAGTMQFFTGMMHIPAFLAVLAILAEFLGPILVALGFLTRLAALAIVANMVVAVATIHLQNGFFMNWSGQQKGEGMEFFVFAIVVGLVIAIAGPGKYALDARIASLSSAA